MTRVIATLGLVMAASVFTSTQATADPFDDLGQQAEFCRAQLDDMRQVRLDDIAGANQSDEFASSSTRTVRPARLATFAVATADPTAQKDPYQVTITVKPGKPPTVERVDVCDVKTTVKVEADQLLLAPAYKVTVEFTQFPVADYSCSVNFVKALLVTGPRDLTYEVTTKGNFTVIFTVDDKLVPDQGLNFVVDIKCGKIAK